MSQRWRRLSPKPLISHSSVIVLHSDGLFFNPFVVSVCVNKEIMENLLNYRKNAKMPEMYFLLFLLVSWSGMFSKPACCVVISDLKAKNVKQNHFRHLKMFGRYPEGLHNWALIKNHHHITLLARVLHLMSLGPFAALPQQCWTLAVCKELLIIFPSSGAFWSELKSAFPTMMPFGIL